MKKVQAKFEIGDYKINSLDIIERIEYLKNYLEVNPRSKVRDELEVLKRLADEASQYITNWEDGEELIRQLDFDDYVQELIDEADDPSSVVIQWADYKILEFGRYEYLAKL